MNYTQKGEVSHHSPQENWYSHHSFLVALGLGLLDQQGIEDERLLENTPLLKKDVTDSFIADLMVRGVAANLFGCLYL